MKFPKVTAEERASVLKDYKKGQSITQLCKKYKRCDNTIRRIVDNTFENQERKNARAFYKFPKELQEANLEIEKFLKKIRESETYNIYL